MESTFLFVAAACLVAVLVGAVVGWLAARSTLSAAVDATPASAASAFGQAVHRLLEHVQPEGDLPAALQKRVAREFGLDVHALRAAVQMADRIRRGEGAWAWDEAVVDWSGSEVELAFEGESLRLDRLVRRAETGEWWVLDFKSASAPEHDAALLAQMRRYRDAVSAANPGAAVRSAFLTGEGRMRVLP